VQAAVQILDIPLLNPHKPKFVLENNKAASNQRGQLGLSSDRRPISQCCERGIKVAGVSTVIPAVYI